MDKTKIYAEEMTLRDYFAGQALIGCCATDCLIIDSIVAEKCYEIADAMMQERDK